MDTPVVTVRGEARLEAPPDLATLSVTVHSTGSGADPVREELARASARLRELLEDHTGAIAQFSTSGLHVAPVLGSKSGLKITGYSGSFSTSIDVHDFDALSDLVFALSPLPNCQVDGPYWSLRPENPIYREVRLAAIVEARRRADDYAAAVQLEVDRLLEISDLDAGLGSPRHARMGWSGQSDESVRFDFEPAMQSVHGSITVRYALTAG